ncbi:MAG TPA: endolytic transglycosylase MltG, partial [Chroococcales cyanobacterium]
MISKYQYDKKSSRIPRRLWQIGLILVALILVATLLTWQYYERNLKPVSSSTKTQYVTIASGSSVNQIADQLAHAKLIRSSQVFQWYVSSHNDRDKLQAGTYKFSPSESVQDIVKAMVTGAVAKDLVTIIPGA